MGGGFYISKFVGVVGIVFGAGAVATIIALAVVYSQEVAKNEAVSPTNGGSTIKPPVTTPGGSTVKPQITTPVIPTTAPSNEPWDKYRLPDTLKPDHYNLTLWPRLTVNAQGLYIFTGKSYVVFQCVKETDLILIHSNKLNYTKWGDDHLAKLSALGSTPAPTIKKSWLQPTTQFLVLELNGKLAVGESYQLDTVFVGELADDLGGFYRSVYTEEGEEKVVATTQMQPTDARKAFPCFDEPAMKAIFHITLLHPPMTVALSNGMEHAPVAVTEVGPEGPVSVWRTSFDETKKMSTYLLAFIVSDYDYINSTNDNVLIRIYARKKAIADGQGEYALNKTGPILKFFEKYYNATYPLPKSDQIALPDFNAGAMENWGLITYRETALLYDPKMSSNSNKERIATIIAHELAHMWFGNLVTLRWWNDLWLNEGFASYVEYLGANEAEPDWNIKDLIVLGDVHRVFAVDALASSHPLSSREEDIQKPEQISELFDAISYSKGASVLRMLSDFLSEEVFSTGLSTYLNKFAYDNTVYTDLWDHLQMAVNSTGTTLPTGQTVHSIMNRWVLQMGFPVVTINTTTGQINQQHFLLDPSTAGSVPPSDFNYEWIVPIRWMNTGVVKQQTWLEDKTANKPEMTVTGSNWILANLNVSGYYRVNYDNTNWERLLGVLSSHHESIPVINRAQLVDDAFNLARAKYINTTLALRTTKYLRSEREYMPWESALDNLDFFYLMFDRSEIYGDMQTYLKYQIEPLFKHFGNITGNWTEVPTGHMDQYNQVNAIRVACSTGMEECQTLTKGWYSQWMKDSANNPIHPNLRTTVYCSAIAAGGAAEWEFGWDQFKAATIAIEADKLRSALACTKQPWLLNKYLEYTLDANQIRKQDATSTIVYIASNVVGQSLAWDFMRDRWNYIFTQYGGGSFSFSNLINGVTKRFSTEFELKQLKQFQADNSEVGFGSGTLAVSQSIERTTANIKWVAENKDSVQTWFTTEVPKE
uniref:aminopeptidase Ey-like isoform X1 n=1 Tax=Oncorhynchus gorbuscha TaxID=8017 RepID=UPI001EAE9BBC|nr:aminopeptidase Ey-like isoform X1 [Oncorhynchus gorbuscha]